MPTPNTFPSPALRWLAGALFMALGIGLVAFGLSGPHGVFAGGSGQSVVQAVYSVVIGCLCVVFSVLVVVLGFERLSRWGRRR